MTIRSAVDADTCGMSEVLNQILAASGRSDRRDKSYALERYVSHQARIACFVFVEAGPDVLGFQSLKMAWVGNPYGVTPGWGIIGTHIRPQAARRGVGIALFERTLQAARDARIPAIDATIGSNNEPGLSFYEKLGFRSYRRFEDCICKAYEIPTSKR